MKAQALIGDLFRYHATQYSALPRFFNYFPKGRSYPTGFFANEFGS